MSLTHAPQSPPPSAAPIYAEVDGLPVALDLSRLSASGLFAYTTSPPARNEAVQVYLRIDGQSATLSGTVTCVVGCDAAAAEGSRPGFGLRFVKVGAAEQRFLREVQKAPAGGEQATSASAASPAERTFIRTRGEHAKPGQERALVAVREALEKELARQERYAAHRVLRLDENASPAAARHAFRSVAKRAHPHRYAKYRNAEVTRLATQVFIGYRRALARLLREQLEE